METTPENITELKPNEVFVFGSNLAGRHGKGAALSAMKFGAIRGMGAGPMGQTYAIPTKDEHLQPLSPAQIGFAIRTFLVYARCTPRKKFLVTPIGCGLAGFGHDVIARLFFIDDIPENVILPKSFEPFRP